MSAYQLKLLAIAAMFCDHLGEILLPDVLWLRVVGRLTMPIMCFLIGEGYRHTHNVRRYMGRLLLFALLSEVAFDLAFYGRLFYPFAQNVFFTLTLGLLGIYLFERYRHGMGGLLVLLCGVAAQLIMADYGFWGVLLIFALYFYSQNVGSLFFVLVVFNVILNLGTVQMAGVLAILPLSLYNGERGPDMRYAFYLFYPLHLLFLAYLSGHLLVR